MRQRAVNSRFNTVWAFVVFFGLFAVAAFVLALVSPTFDYGEVGRLARIAEDLDTVITRSPNGDVQIDATEFTRNGHPLATRDLADVEMNIWPPQQDQVLAWNGNRWMPQDPSRPPNGFQRGQTLLWDGSQWQASLEMGQCPGSDTFARKVFSNGTVICEQVSGITEAQVAPERQKGIPNGVASLDASGKVPAAQLPSLSIVNVTVCYNFTCCEGLEAQSGDICKTEEPFHVFMWDGSGWFEIHANSDVISVNGQMGVVTLNSDDILEGASNRYLRADSVGASDIRSFSVINPKLGTFSVSEMKLSDGSVTSVKLGIAAVTTSKLAMGAVDINRLAMDSVTTSKVMDRTLQGIDMALQTILGENVASETLDTLHIRNGTLLGVDLKNGTITTLQLQEGAVTAAILAENSVTASKIAVAVITTAKLADGSVTTAKLATAAVTTDKVASEAITNSKLAALSVTTAKLDAAAVTSAKLAVAAVTTTELADASVTEAKLAPNAVTTNKLATGAVTGTKLATNTITETNMDQSYARGSANGVASLDSAAKVPMSQLPNNLVRGPPSTAANSIARFNDTSGTVVKGSLITIDDSGNMDGVGTISGVNVVAVKAFVDRRDNPTEVTKAQVGLAFVPNIKERFDSTVPPGINDDSTADYSAGSTWVDIAADAVYVCTDASPGAATWERLDRYPGAITTQYLADGAVTSAKIAADTIVEADMSAAYKRGVSNGVATLGSDGKVPNAQLPPLQVNAITVCADLTCCNTLTPANGDICKTTSTSTTYMWDGVSWIEISSPAAVDDVCGYTGSFCLDTDDVGEGSTNLYFTQARVTANAEVSANTIHRASISNPHGLTKSQLGLSHVQNIKVNYAATVSPGASDDSVNGYSAGSTWINTVTEQGYLCVDDTASAAVWKEVSSVTMAANIGSAGQGVFKQRLNGVLEFYKLHSTSPALSISADAVNDKIDFGISPSNIDHDQLLNYISNRHVDHASVAINAGAGLSGGGSIVQDRTLQLAIQTLPQLNLVDPLTDTLLIYDASDGSHKQLEVQDLPMSGSNLGSGASVFKEKTGSQLRFRSLTATKVTVTENSNDIALSIDDSTIDHDSLSNYDAAKHVSHSSVSIVAGSGLSGGGTIEATRTIDLDINELPATTMVDAANDYLAIYDQSGGVHRKVAVEDLPTAGGGVIFGADFEHELRTAEIQTTSTNWVDFTQWGPSNGPYTGVYKLEWQAEIGNYRSNRRVEMRFFRTDGGNVQMSDELMVSANEFNYRFLQHFVRIFVLSNESPTFKLQVETENNGIVKMANELWQWYRVA